MSYKDVLAMVGAVVLLMAIAGGFGIGHFRLYYTDHSVTCTRDAPPTGAQHHE